MKRPIEEKRRQDEKRAVEDVVAKKEFDAYMQWHNEGAERDLTRMRKRVQGGTATRAEEQSVATLDRLEGCKTGERLEKGKGNV